MEILNLKTVVGLLTFIFDKSSILVGVLQDGDCIVDKLKQELEDNIENIDLLLYLTNNNTDTIIEHKFNLWLDEFEYFKS